MWDSTGDAGGGGVGLKCNQRAKHFAACRLGGMQVVLVVSVEPVLMMIMHGGNVLMSLQWFRAP